jgi:hypothetical protein
MSEQSISEAKTKVYFVEDRGGRVKIGYSSDPLSRIMALQTAHATRLSVIRLIDGGRPTEKWLHGRFAHLRVKGEWFDFNEDMMTVVPPDEVPVRLVVKPSLRITLRENVRRLDAMDFLGKRHFAAALLTTFWDEDIDAFMAWARERAGVAEPQRQDDAA